MDHPLHDCRVKIAGAKKRFDELHDEVVAFGKEPQNRPSIGVDVDLETGEQVLDFGKPPRLPDQWSVAVGEIAHNCRSALNYLVAILVHEAGGKKDGSSAFPLAEDESFYLGRNKSGVTYRDRVLRGVPEPQRETIDGFQPYTDGDMAFRHPLALLGKLNNPDKHELPQAAFGSIEFPTHILRLPTTDPLEGVVIRLNPGISVETKATRGRGRLPVAIAISPKMYVNYPIKFQVVFGAKDPSRLVSMDDLRGIVTTTETVVETFGPDLEVKPGPPGHEPVT